MNQLSRLNLGLRSNGHSFVDDVAQCELREIKVNDAQWGASIQVLQIIVFKALLFLYNKILMVKPHLCLDDTLSKSFFYSVEQISHVQSKNCSILKKLLMFRTNASRSNKKCSSFTRKFSNIQKNKKLSMMDLILLHVTQS